MPSAWLLWVDMPLSRTVVLNEVLIGKEFWCQGSLLRLITSRSRPKLLKKSAPKNSLLLAIRKDHRKVLS